MGLFDSFVNSLEKQASRNEYKARASYGSKLNSAIKNTDDPAKKSELVKEWRENNEAMRNIKY